MPTESDFVNAPPKGAGQPVEHLRETLSALVDGEASEQETRTVANALADWPAQREVCADYMWLGEALRAGEQTLPPASASFVAGVMGRIHAETEAVKARPASVQPLETAPMHVNMPEAANDAVFRWKMVAGVATLAAAAALVWQVAVAPATGPQLAQGPTQAAEPMWVREGTQAVLTERGVVIRDPQLEALLAEHRQYGGMSALQMPAGFLRNATYEAPQR